MMNKLTINTTIQIKSLSDLKKLKSVIEVNNLGKPNFTRLAKQLGVDRRTVKKYYEGRNKNEQKRKGSKIDSYKEIIDKLLSTDNKTQQIFYYKIHLYRYLVREYGLKCSRSNFNRYILLNKQYSEYFNPKECPNAIKTETQFGKQAQFDWKEKLDFYFKDGVATRPL